MAGRSSIDRLPAPIRDAVNKAIGEGATVDDLVELIASRGGAASRSAVGRYTKSFATIVERQKDIQAISEAFGSKFADAGDHQGRLTLQLINSMVTKTVLAFAEKEDGDEEIVFSPQDLHFLARTAKDLQSAAKTDVEREAKIREEAVKKARREAAEIAEREMKAGGATSDSIQRVRRELLGLSS